MHSISLGRRKITAELEFNLLIYLTDLELIKESKEFWQRRSRCFDTRNITRAMNVSSFYNRNENQEKSKEKLRKSQSVKLPFSYITFLNMKMKLVANRNANKKKRLLLLCVCGGYTMVEFNCTQIFDRHEGRVRC